MLVVLSLCFAFIMMTSILPEFHLNPNNILKADSKVYFTRDRSIPFSISNQVLLGFGKDITNSHWSGYVAETSYSSPQRDFDTVCGSWIVQSVSSSSYGNAAQWIGIGGATESSKTLIQTGTDSESTLNGVSYYAWYELCPSGAIVIPINIQAGNIISASVYLDELGSHNWQIHLSDITTGEQFTSPVFNYDSGQLSAEWIEENPNTLADFGIAQFGASFTHSTPDQAVMESGSSEYAPNNYTFNPNRVPEPPLYYISQLAYYKINMVVDGTLLASTSGLTGTHQSSFTVQWENSS